MQIKNRMQGFAYPALFPTSEMMEPAGMKILLSALLTLSLVSLSALPASAQQYKYETPMPPGVATPDKVETSIGTLNLSSG
jgi:hypothetical protein